MFNRGSYLENAYLSSCSYWLSNLDFSSRSYTNLTKQVKKIHLYSFDFVADDKGAQYNYGVFFCCMKKN